MATKSNVGTRQNMPSRRTGPGFGVAALVMLVPVVVVAAPSDWRALVRWLHVLAATSWLGEVVVINVVFVTNLTRR